MIQGGDPRYAAHLAEQEARAWAAQQEAIAEAAESRRKFDDLVNRASEWFVAGRNKAVRLVPQSMDLAAFGQGRTVSSGKTVGLLRWNGQPDENLVLTIDFSRDSSNSGAEEYPTARDPSGTPYDYAPYAIVSSGAGNFTGQAFEIDIGSGTRITLAGSAFNVAVGMDAPLPGFAAGTMKLGAIVGVFSAHTTAPAIRTRRTGAVPGGGGDLSGPHFVPSRATQLLPPRCSRSDGQGRIKIVDASGATLDEWGFASGMVVAAAPLPLGAFAAYVTNTGTYGTSYQLPFQLAV